MSIRYTVENLKEMREAAGLGVLSMGVCAISGELVSSTPIPDSRCGHAGQNVADYGGYLLGEGMSKAAALYLANLHNWFPTLAEALEKLSPEWEEGSDAECLELIRKAADKAGWTVFDGYLADWISEHLVSVTAEEAINIQKAALAHAEARLAAIDAAKAGEPPMPGIVADPWDVDIKRLSAWGRQGWDAAAALREELMAPLRDALKASPGEWVSYSNLDKVKAEARAKERGALSPWLQHKLNCEFEGSDPDHTSCTCGLFAALEVGHA